MISVPYQYGERPTSIIVHPEFKERAERILRIDHAERMLRTARRALHCSDRGAEDPTCPALEVMEWVGEGLDSEWFSHAIAASLILDGLAAEDLTAVGA